MPDEPGLAFNEVAEQYDRVRPGYPPSLVESACAIGGLRAGSEVVEIGCGTGKLTKLLVERGLVIDAVDPGSDMVRIARRKVGGAPVRFHVDRFEDVKLPFGTFAAAFSAMAFHWVDPAVGWSKVALLLRPSGMLALLGHASGYSEDRCRAVDEEIHAAWQQVVPDGAWRPHGPEEIDEAVQARRGNVSELWSFLSQQDLQHPEAAELFGDVRIETFRIETDQTANDLLAVIRTTSTYLQLDGHARRQLEDRIRDVIQRTGGLYQGVDLVALVTARACPTR